MVLIALTVFQVVSGDTQAPQVQISSVADILKIFCNAAFWLFTFVVVIAVLAILYAAFRYITAGGEDKNVEEGRKILTYAVIGIVVALLAFTVIDVVYSFLATGNGAGIFTSICGGSSGSSTPPGGTLAQDGSSCTDNSQCSSGFCSPLSNTCQENPNASTSPNASSQSCQYATDCAQGQTCINNQCVNKLAHGQTGCVTSSDCAGSGDANCTASDGTCSHVCLPVNGVFTCVGLTGDGCLLPGMPGYQPGFDLCAQDPTQNLDLTCQQDPTTGSYRCLPAPTPTF